MGRQQVGTVAALYCLRQVDGRRGARSGVAYWHGIEGDRRQVFVKSAAT